MKPGSGLDIDSWNGLFDVEAQASALAARFNTKKVG